MRAAWYYNYIINQIHAAMQYASGSNSGGSSNSSSGPAINGQQQPNSPKMNSPVCRQAKARLSNLAHQVSAQDQSFRHDYFKSMLASAGIGCTTGVIGGEAIETPAVGTPAAAGNCAVGAAGGVAFDNLGYLFTHLNEFGTGVSLMGQEAVAAENVINACY